jgi:hypothetical protein
MAEVHARPIPSSASIAKSPCLVSIAHAPRASRKRVTDRLGWRENATGFAWTIKQKQIWRLLDVGLSAVEFAEIRHFPRFAQVGVSKAIGPAGTKNGANSAG